MEVADQLIDANQTSWSTMAVVEPNKQHEAKKPNNQVRGLQQPEADSFKSKYSKDRTETTLR